jgi:hypothetical protein
MNEDGRGNVRDEDCEIYPFRAREKRNKPERFLWGRIYPQALSQDRNGAEPCAMQTECLFQTHSNFARLEITFAFLQPVAGTIGVFERVLHKDRETGEIYFEAAPQLEAAGETFQAWMEGAQRKVSIVIAEFSQNKSVPFIFPITASREEIRNEHGHIAGVIMRRHEILEGRLEIRFTEVREDLFRVCARVVNLTAIEPSDMNIPENILLRTFASAHFALELENGEFVSLLEPPEEFEMHAEVCKNIGCWPVLMGDRLADDRTAMLASPVIFRDYPEIHSGTTQIFAAPEIHANGSVSAMPMPLQQDESGTDDSGHRITRLLSFADGF